MSDDEQLLIAAGIQPGREIDDVNARTADVQAPDDA